MSKKKPNREPPHEQTKWSRTALGLMRLLNYEIQSEGSEDVVALRLAGVLKMLAPIAKAGRYIGEARQIEAAAQGIDKDLALSYPLLRANSRRPLDSRGLAEDPVLLKAYCEMAAESSELENWKDAEPNEEVLEQARAYDQALKQALEELVRKFPPMDDATADDLWQQQAPYLVLMTLRGDGVGIWDGDWDHFYEDTSEAEKFLKKRLGKFADEVGSGSLEEAFRDAAYESCGEPDEDEDDDDQDEDDE